jgi:mandelate racemase
LARAVDVPMRRPLGTAIGQITSAPLVLVDIETHEDIVGHAYLFCYRRSATYGVRAILSDIGEMLLGTAVAPIDIETSLLRQLRLIGHSGLIAMALSAVDIACWDILAQAADMPLVQLLGGISRPIPAYNSNGLGLNASPKAAAEEALSLVEGDFDAIKIRLGYPTLGRDLETLHAVRAALPPNIWIACDYNQGLDKAEALRRCRALDSERLAWIEEPIAYDDFQGNAHIAQLCETPIQIGENFLGLRMMASAIATKASDLVMPDLQRIGGVTGWMRASALAAAHNIPMSSHLFPEVSAHLLAVTPTADHLEYVDWSAPILAEPLVILGGQATAPDRPGTGVSWDEDAIARFLID